ncbi:MAG: hypothetical protein Q4G47_02220 [Lachnospiraceae bacterium]|nr:hypothetical protein [Lachnospiraceae bacterium]
MTAKEERQKPCRIKSATTSLAIWPGSHPTTVKAAAMEGADIERIGLFILETFFLRPYEDGEFYHVALKRMSRGRRFLKM